MSRPPLELVGEGLATLSAYRTRPDAAPIKLDANESPWPLPDEARARLAEVLRDAPLHRYPDLLATELRAALAERMGAAPDELLLGVGSDEVIGILMAAFGQPRSGAARAVALYPSPSFVMYPITARVHGLEPVEVALREDWSLDLAGMRAAIEAHRPNLVFLATPNNPTGNAFDEEALLAIVEAAPDALVVIDEAYAPFRGHSHSRWVERHANVGVLATLSKVGLAGVRLGWIRMHRELVAEAEKARPPYNLGTLTQLAAQLFLREMPWVLDAQVQAIVAERSRLQDALRAIPGVRVHPSVANFLLIEVGDAPLLHAAMLARGVQLRAFSSEPRLARHLRVTVGTPEENDRLLAALREAIPEAVGEAESL
jgi:histidinol-phosphate aminotransferase